MKPSTVLICVCLIVAAFFTGQIVEAANQEVSLEPNKETAVTCYKWVENGSAEVICPDTVYAPDSVVNITVNHCDEYQYANDEPHVCPQETRLP
jgi:hypothetical protein